MHTLYANNISDNDKCVYTIYIGRIIFRNTLILILCSFFILIADNDHHHVNGSAIHMTNSHWSLEDNILLNGILS